MKKSRKFLVLLLSAAVALSSFGGINVNASDVVSESASEDSVKKSDKVYSNFKTSGKIWIAGDSIAADHSYENEEDYAVFVHGWGEIIGDYLTDDAQVNNLAISGQTAKFFTEEDNYRQIMDKIGKGDLLIISFGHNDYKSAGKDHSTLPTSVEGSYKWYLKNYYIDPAIEAGAMPVLCTSVVLCELTDGHVIEKQNQSAFAQAMRELYAEYTADGIEIGFIDTYMLTQSVLNVYNSSAASFYALKYDKNTDENGNRTTSLDHVHFSYKGADMAARMIAENLFVMYRDFNRYNKNAEMQGEGTEKSPYLISNSAQFFQIMQDEQLNSEDKFYKLTQNIDCVIDNESWEKVFNANLDGNGFTITNPINRSSNSFIDKNYGTIKNVKLKYGLYHTAFDVQYPFIKENYGKINNCSAVGSIYIDNFLNNKNSCYCGIFAGENKENAVISNCSNEVSITINSDIPSVAVGGIAGINKGKIANCSNKGYVLADLTEYLGVSDKVHEKVICAASGIAGLNYENAAILDCISTQKAQARSELDAKVVYIIDDLLAVDIKQTADSDPNDGDGNKPDNNEEKIIKGDANLNGKVDLPDAKLALKYALGIEKAEGESLKAVDLNGDNKVNLNEAKIILKCALGIIKGI